MHRKRLKIESHLARNQRMPSQHVVPNRSCGISKGAQRETEANITEIVNRKQRACPFSPLQNHQIRAAFTQHRPSGTVLRHARLTGDLLLGS
jgi:hypothetical protein